MSGHGFRINPMATLDAEAQIAPMPANTPIEGVAALRAGQALRGRFACPRKDRLTARNGKPYLALELRDRTGSIPARVFRDPDLLGSRFERGDAIEVKGRVDTFKGELVAEVTDLRRIDPADVDPAMFLPSAYRSVEELLGFFEHLTREIHHPGLRQVVERVLADPEVSVELRRAPCTRAAHHAYLGGLLEHTVSVATLASEVCLLHPRLNSDLLIAAALLHDIGKTREFTYGAEFAISDEGRLLGHLNLGAEIINRLAGALDADTRLALLHCVLSHHGADSGAGGFASPEALALYRLNALDSSVKGALERGG